MPLCEDKKVFLLHELGILTLKAAFSTRTECNPIYSRDCSDDQRATLQGAIRREFAAIESTYSDGRVPEELHYDYIESLAHRVTRAHSVLLHDGQLRFGVAQKLVNLYLKYLWVAGFVEEPPHCPIDRIVRTLARLDYDWTSSDSRRDYERAVTALKRCAQPRSLAVWELQEFRRRSQ